MGAGRLLLEMQLQLGAAPAAAEGATVKLGCCGYFGALLLCMPGFGSPRLFWAHVAYAEPRKPDVISPKEGCKSLLFA